MEKRAGDEITRAQGYVEDPPGIQAVGYLRRRENGLLVIHSCDSFVQGVFLQKDGTPGHQPP